MKLLRNLIIVSVLICVLFLGALWWGGTALVSAIEARVEPYVELDYAGVWVALDGQVDLTDVVITPKSGGDPIHIEQLTWVLPGLDPVFAAAVGKAKFPEEALLRIKGLRATWYTGLRTSSGEPFLGPLTQVPFESFGCGTRKEFLAEDLERMELGTPSPVQEIRFRIDLARERAEIDLHLAGSGLASTDAEFVLSRVPLREQGLASFDKVRLERFRIQFADEGYLAKRNALCAEIIKDSPSRFLQAHVHALRSAFLTNEVELSPELLRQYRFLINNGGKLAVEGRPSPKVSLAQYAFFSPPDVLQLLNASVRLDDQSPEPLMLGFAERPLDEEQAHAQIIAGEPVIPEPVTPIIGDPVSDPLAGTGNGSGEPPQPDPGTGPGPVGVSGAGTPGSNGVATSTSEDGERPATDPEAMRNFVRALAEATVPEPLPQLGSGRSRNDRSGSSGGTETAGNDTPVATTDNPDGGGEVVEPRFRLPKPGEIERLPDTAFQQTGSKRWRTIGYADLERLSGKRVRIYTLGGKEHEGLVESFADGGVVLKVRASGGMAVYAVPEEVVTEVQVYVPPPTG